MTSLEVHPSANLDAATVDFLNEVSSTRCLHVTKDLNEPLRTLDYIEYLEISFTREPELAWIAREMACAPMPSSAEMLISKSGIVYFHDIENDYYTLEHPLTQRYLKVLERQRIDMIAMRSRPGVSMLVFRQPDVLFHAQFKHIQLPCQDCGVMQSTLHCEQCMQSYCDACFGNLHSRGLRKSHKTHPTAAGSMCSSCNTKKPQAFCASCGDYFCFACFEQMHKRGFRSDHKAVLVAVSEGDTIAEESRCDECQDQKAAVHCDFCLDKFCVSCFWRCHLNGNRRKHTVTKAAVSPLCGHCDDTRATVFCEQCQELFCTDCFTNFHQKGGRQLHLFVDATNVLLLLERMDPAFAEHMVKERVRVVTAVSKIQALVRGMQVRKQLARRKEVVTKIQQRWRGASTRKKLLSMLDHLKWRKKQFASYFLPKTRQEKLENQQKFTSQYDKKEIASKTTAQVLEELRGTIMATAAADPLEDPSYTVQALKPKKPSQEHEIDSNMEMGPVNPKQALLLAEDAAGGSLFKKNNDFGSKQVRQLLKIDSRLPKSN